MVRKFVTLGALVPALALALFAMPALAADDGNDTVNIDNEGAVVNTVTADANSGFNYAGGADGGNGGDAGDAGDGGDISQGGDGDGDEYEVEDSTTGNGGAGGNGGNGGTGGGGGIVVTGDAFAGAGVENYVNTNDVVINRCACGGGDEDEGHTRVNLSNTGAAVNLVGAGANSGFNAAGAADAGNGGEGGEGGHGGDIDQDGGDYDYEVEDSSTGHGGRGGNGGHGGTGGGDGGVGTGFADSLAAAVNFVNTNVVRIRR